MREPDHELLENLKKDKPDVIWPVLHGASGEDGALRDILSLTGIPFVGASGASAKLAWDKSVAKILASRAGIQTPSSITLPACSVKLQPVFYRPATPAQFWVQQMHPEWNTSQPKPSTKVCRFDPSKS